MWSLSPNKSGRCSRALHCASTVPWPTLFRPQSSSAAPQSLPVPLWTQGYSDGDQRALSCSIGSRTRSLRRIGSPGSTGRARSPTMEGQMTLANARSWRFHTNFTPEPRGRPTVRSLSRQRCSDTRGGWRVEWVTPSPKPDPRGWIDVKRRRGRGKGKKTEIQ